MNNSPWSKEKSIRFLVVSWLLVALSFILTLIEAAIFIFLIASAGGDSTPYDKTAKLASLLFKILPFSAVGFAMLSMILSGFVLSRHQEKGQAIFAICCGSIFPILYLFFYLII